MTSRRDPDELPPAVVAAIVAALAALEQPEDAPVPVLTWARSGRVAPSWRATGRECWRSDERERAWR